MRRGRRPFPDRERTRPGRFCQSRTNALAQHNVTAKALNTCATQLNGSATAPEYYRRRRRVFFNSGRDRPR
ncbi:hypothetical protein [Nonomuraea jabiensis]|uniref:hypothetical protein n=1 Tax=Nonomuraea jabiensis TaxID=882448 RepID=UPI003D74361E